MFDIQSGIRIVTSVTSVIAMSMPVSGDDFGLGNFPPPIRSLPPAEANAVVEVLPQAVVEKEPRIFSSGPVDSEQIVAVPADPPAQTDQPRPADGVPLAVPSAAVGAIEISPPATEIAPAAEAMPTEQYFAPSNNAPVYCCNKNLPHRWFSVESLIWWTSQPDVPVIATTSPQGTPGLQAGVLGQSQTGVLWGGSDLFDLTRAGVRLRAGKWSSDNDGSGFQAEFFMLGSAGHNFLASSNGNPILARPFFNEQTGAPDSQLIAFPGLSTGSLRFNAETRLYSVGLNYWAELVAECVDECGEPTCQSTCCNEHTDRLLGIRIGPRFIHHDDTILADESLTGLASGNQFRIMDSFKTENSFLGAEIGLRSQRNRGIYSMDLGLNLGIGATRQELDVSGLTTITTPAGLQTTTAGGFLAQTTNSGSWNNTEFSLVPSLEFKLAMEAGNGWRFAVGYDLMYWTNVLRAAEQIDTTIHPNLFPPQVNPTGATRPAPLLNESDYFAHGISVSIERRW